MTQISTARIETLWRGRPIHSNSHTTPLQNAWLNPHDAALLRRCVFLRPSVRGARRSSGTLRVTSKGWGGRGGSQMFLCWPYQSAPSLFIVSTLWQTKSTHVCQVLAPGSPLAASKTHFATGCLNSSHFWFMHGRNKLLHSCIIQRMMAWSDFAKGHYWVTKWHDFYWIHSSPYCCTGGPPSPQTLITPISIL